MRFGAGPAAARLMHNAAMSALPRLVLIDVVAPETE
jgi:hypothetical protein